MLTSRPYTFDRVIRIILTIASIVGIFYLLNLIKGALLPFVVAWLIAYLLNPLVIFFQTKCRIRNRLLAIITTLLLIILLLTAIGATLIPSIIDEVSKTSEVIQNISKTTNLGPIVEKAWYQSLIDKLNFEDISKLLNPEEWSTLIENTMTHAWTILSGSINQIMSIVGWLIVVLYLVFILIDYDKIINGFKELIPQQYRDMTLSILTDVEDGMNRYFRGQSLIALCVGILFSIGFVIIGLPLAIPLGLFIGLLNLVPYLQIVGLIPTILLCFLGSYSGHDSFWGLFGLSMIVFAVVQSIQDIYITPRIMGKATGLNPAVILLSLSIWGSLLGMLGMIIALPLTSLLLAYYQKYIIGESDKRVEEPFAEPIANELDDRSEKQNIAK